MAQADRTLDLDKMLAAADPAVRLMLQQEMKTYMRVTPVGIVHRRMLLTVPTTDELVALTVRAKETKK